ncbi:HNH endonuclease [Archangium lansingense]|uniref:HNH endonuclease signature motif containing protein n=1 Tax=Archangium lansingense TaxID=2995310 RepID=A0ABT4APX0_9BACT|nr:HNH endonuclease signature motif containing protein [Archangium lansinium]MCY1083748.1 HNH endonuclease signature motif containing protein [Archangium lansinium]
MSHRKHEVYEKDKGKCRYCGKRLSIKNHGKTGSRGAWQIDHSRSRRNQGTDHLNNLAAACVACNQEKGGRNARAFKAELRARGVDVPTRKKKGFLARLLGL